MDRCGDEGGWIECMDDTLPCGEGGGMDVEGEGGGLEAPERMLEAYFERVSSNFFFSASVLAASSFSISSSLVFSSN